ncbi:MAG: hypothetical protein JNN04_16440 [Cyclobacteriaceae bacterium]|nr:hypothetical protein [Cyclobacteriaceae bacterium]
MVRLNVAILLLCLGCGKSLPALEGVDVERWRADKNACLGRRAQMQDALLKEKDKLKGLSEMDIVSLLGRPDKNELYKRNQKFYIYYVGPGPDCDSAEELPALLVIRFNAMGYAQLVSVGSTGP